MNILVIGSGGREHALVWKIRQSPLVKKLYCAPGNGGIEEMAECVDIASDDIAGLLKFAKTKKIGLTVVGPEAALVAGIVDAFEKEKLMIFGPSKRAARLEGSKVFAKEAMREFHVPTAAFQSFDNYETAKSFLEKAQYPIVVKADGLAGGKGVMLCDNLLKAQEAVDQIMKQKIFKEAGAKIVVEECLKGEEVSILAISDGNNFVILDGAQDHKRIFDDDIGPNTGGMGAYSPTPFVDEEMLKTIETRIIDPVIRGMRREGIPFKGVLYAGIMITEEGPKVLEFNVRFGDPETQVLLPRLKNDLVEMMAASCEGRLEDMHLAWDKRRCVCVVMSSGGYPGKYEAGFEIKGLTAVQKDLETIVFHSGTKKEDGNVVTAGGRVLGVTALGDTIEEAINHVYASVEKISFTRCFFRRDIGAKAFAHPRKRSKAITRNL